MQKRGCSIAVAPDLGQPYAGFAPPPKDMSIPLKSLSDNAIKDLYEITDRQVKEKLDVEGLGQTSSSKHPPGSDVGIVTVSEPERRAKRMRGFVRQINEAQTKEELDVVTKSAQYFSAAEGAEPLTVEEKSLIGTVGMVQVAQSLAYGKRIQGSSVVNTCRTFSTCQGRVQVDPELSAVSRFSRCC